MIEAAFILAGGKGSRLAPWPAPKCLLPINGIPMIARLITHITSHVNRIIVCTGYRSDDVRAALRERHLMNLFFSDAGENATMCERLLQAKEEYQIADRTLVCYGDEICDVNMTELEAYHDSRGGVLTFTACNQMLSFGIVQADKRIVSNHEVLINIGYVVADPPAWKRIDKKDGLAEWINRNDVNCFVHKGKRATVNNYIDLRRAEEIWK